MVHGYIFSIVVWQAYERGWGLVPKWPKEVRNFRVICVDSKYTCRHDYQQHETKELRWCSSVSRAERSYCHTLKYNYQDGQYLTCLSQFNYQHKHCSNNLGHLHKINM